MLINGDPDSFKGGVSARVYQSVLNQYLLPILGFRYIFMQDNASIYKVYIIRDWFRERGYEVID